MKGLRPFYPASFSLQRERSKENNDFPRFAQKITVFFLLLFLFAKRKSRLPFTP
jgi:hypothetical protein